MDFDEYVSDEDEGSYKDYGDYRAQWNPNKGMMSFVRIKGKGPIPSILSGHYTGFKFTDEAYQRLLSSGHRVDKRTQKDKAERKALADA